MSTGIVSDPTLERWLRPGTALPDLVASSATEVLEELAQSVARALPRVSAAAIRGGFLEREALGTTAIGGGFAIPHCRLPGISGLYLGVARHPQGVDFGALDGEAVKVFFALVAPQSGASAHLEALRAIARFLRDPRRRELLLEARGTEELVQLLQGAPARDPRSGVTADV